MPFSASSLQHILSAALRPLIYVYRWIWPKISPVTLLAYADTLADSVMTKEKRALRELGGYRLGTELSIIDAVATFKTFVTSDAGAHSIREHRLNEIGEYFRNIDKQRAKRLVIL